MSGMAREGPRCAVTAVAAMSIGIALGACGAAAATLTLPADAGAPSGDLGVAYLSTDDAGGVLGTDLLITYDPAVATATTVTTTGVAASHFLAYNLEPPGTIRISLYGPAPLSGSGDLLAISFLATGPPGGHTVLDLASAELNEGGIAAALVDGAFCVEGLGEEVVGLRAARSPDSTVIELSWIDQGYAESYNLYRGPGPDLAGLECLLADIPGTDAADDGLMPPPGVVFVYLVTGNLCSGESSAGADSSGVSRIVPWPCV